MRISDWSSDVCSSDLQQARHADQLHRELEDRLAAAHAAVEARDGEIESLVTAHATELAAHRETAQTAGALRVELPQHAPRADGLAQPGARKSAGEGKRVAARVGLRGRRNIKKKNKQTHK